jgi:serine/threonine protein kinase
VGIGPGSLIDGRYRVGRRIALGATSEVFVGRDERLERPVALKVLREEGFDARRFRSEARLLANLDHPCLVRVFDALEADNAAVLVMEIVDGPSLATMLALRPLADEEGVSVGCELADCLAYLHAHGVVHRDVKPSNVLVGHDRRARLADFGIARLVDATRLTATGQAIGTLAYMAPEQLTGAAVGPPADVYSLGLVLLEAVTGQRAFRGEGSEGLAARLVRGPDIEEDLGPAWRALIAAMTLRDPGARPSAVEVGSRLTQAAWDPTAQLVPTPTVVVEPAASSVTAPVEQMAPPRRGAFTRHGLVWASLLAVAVLVIVVLVAISGGNPSSEHPPTTVPTTAAPVTTAARTTTPATSTTTLVPVSPSKGGGKHGRGRGGGG